MKKQTSKRGGFIGMDNQFNHKDFWDRVRSNRLMETSIINMPFIDNSRDGIKRAKEMARKEYPKYKKIEYVKPKFIKDKKFGDFWTHPNLRLTN